MQISPSSFALYSMDFQQLLTNSIPILTAVALQVPGAIALWFVNLLDPVLAVRPYTNKLLRETFVAAAHPAPEQQIVIRQQNS